MAIDGSRGDPHYVGDLGEGEAGDVLQLPNLGGRAVLPPEHVQGVIQGDETMDRRSDGIDRRLVNHSSLVSFALEAMLAPGVVHENAAHGLGRCGEEVPAAVPVPGLISAHQPEIGLVDQGGGLERLARLLLRHPLGRQLAQPVIDQRKELLRGVRVAMLDRVKQRGDRVHRPGPTGPTGHPCRGGASAERTGDE